jgi:hypothetical protein
MHAAENQPHALDASGQPDTPAHLEERNRRLERMVAELIKANQELRFKMASLERPATEPAPGPHHQSMWAG